MKKTLAILLASVVASNVAFAQTGFYAGAELGSASIKDQSSELDDALVSTLGGSAAVIQDTSIGFGRIFGGYSINKYVAAELGYLNSGEAAANFSGVTSGAVAYAGSAKLSFNGLDISAVITPFDKPGLDRLFFRAGLTAYETEIKVNVAGGGAAAAGTDTESGTGTIFGVGYDLPAGPGFVRFQLNTLQKVSGVTDSDSTALSAGYLWKF